MKASSLVLVGMLAWGGCAWRAGAQTTAPKPDMSLSESRRISPFPPKNVQAEISDGRAVITWTSVQSDRIVGYDVYRAVDDGPLEKIGRAKQPPFVDAKPCKGKLSYAVASVDYNENRSKPRLVDAKIDSPKKN